MFNTGWKALKNKWLSGPFKLDNYNKTQKLSLSSGTTSGGATSPLLDKVVFREIAEDAQAAAFANNEIDCSRSVRMPDSYSRRQGCGRRCGAPGRRTELAAHHLQLDRRAADRQGDPAGDRHGPGPESIGASDLAGIEAVTSRR